MINKDVITAVQEIKNYCYEHFGADGCMESCNFLRNDGKCELKNFYPKDWYVEQYLINKGIKHETKSCSCGHEAKLVFSTDDTDGILHFSELRYQWGGGD